MDNHSRKWANGLAFVHPIVTKPFQHKQNPRNQWLGMRMDQLGRWILPESRNPTTKDTLIMLVSIRRRRTPTDPGREHVLLLILLLGLDGRVERQRLSGPVA